MSGINTFRDLIAWQKGMELAKLVYRLTQEFPDSERFGLITQMRRAGVSIPSNIAEGYARGTRPEYIRFLRIARGSLAELQTQLILAEQLNFMKPTQAINNPVAETDRVLQGLLRSIERKKP